MKIFTKILIAVLFLILLLLSFLLFFKLDFLIDKPVGILSDIFFPGSGLWRVHSGNSDGKAIYTNYLEEPVSVIMDNWGVPHIYAEAEKDLYFTAGYIHSRYRYFQMDMTRRMARGLLSEIIGAGGLESDKFHLALGMDYWAGRTLEELEGNEENRYLAEILNAYSEGVNHFTASNHDNVSLEYVILGVDPSERKWTSTDSLVFSKVMARMLSWNYSDLYNTKSLNAFGKEKYIELKAESCYQIPVIEGYGDWKEYFKNLKDENPDEKHGKIASAFIDAIGSLPFEKQYLEHEKQHVFGSNNWAIDSRLSSTGSPLLCNDMHLARSIPIIWYETHLVNRPSGLNVYGYCLAGVPFPITGFNDNIAWGFTNTGFDVIDWYYYDLVDSNTYIRNGKESRFTRSFYNIPVRNGSPYRLEVRHTEEGPVLSDVLELDILEFPGAEKIIVPRWTAYSVTYELKAIHGINRSRGLEDFNYFSSFFSNPAQNFLYADRVNIMMRPTGKVPIRKDGTGEFIYNGSEGAESWDSFIGFEALPFSLNPEKGYLFSANQVTVGPEYPYTLQTRWDESYRPRRIDSLLGNSSKYPLTHEYMRYMQNDVYSVPAESFIPVIFDVLEEYLIENDDRMVEEALKILSEWDFFMHKDSPAPAIYKAWESFYSRGVFQDEYSRHGLSGYPKLGFLEYITLNDAYSEWFDNIETEGIAESRDDIILDSFIRSADFLKELFDSDFPGDWIWGDMHKAAYNHTARLTGFQRGPYPAGGDGLTINPAPFTISARPGPSTWGASQRLIVDLSDPKKSLSCIPGGQSGRISSKHYSDQLEKLYLNGKYHDVNFYDDESSFPAENIDYVIKLFPGKKIHDFHKPAAGILYSGISILLLIAYLNLYSRKYSGLMIILMFLIVSDIFLISVLGMDFWKAVFFSVIFFNMFLGSKSEIFAFSILATMISWFGYIIYSLYFSDTFANLGHITQAIAGYRNDTVSVIVLMLLSIYCGILCGVISIIFRRIFYRSFRG